MSEGKVNQKIKKSLTLIWKRQERKFLCYSEVYLEPSQTFFVKLFRKNSLRLKAVNYLRKKLHRRCSTGFKIRL